LAFATVTAGGLICVALPAAEPAGAGGAVVETLACALARPSASFAAARARATNPCPTRATSAAFSAMTATAPGRRSSVHTEKARHGGNAPRQPGTKSGEVQREPAALNGNGTYLTGAGDHSASVQSEKAVLHGRIRMGFQSGVVQTVNGLAAKRG
jgi:hypothetical protein